MMGLVIAIHVITCLLLIGIILIQTGRGGGLVENLSNIESVFGPKTNAFLSRTTTALAIIFFITCLILAALSIKQSKSLMGATRPQAQQVSPPAAIPQAAPDTAKQANAGEAH